MKKETMEWIISIGLALLIVGLLYTFIIRPYNVQGDSMDPTLKDGDRLIVNKIGKTLGHLDNGNVIVFHADESADYVKRIIGKPGDHVEYKNDQLYLNGKKVDEPYLAYNLKHKTYDEITGPLNSQDLQGSDGKYKIPKDKYLVLGDNREVSKDSRTIGLIDKDQIVGKVSLRFWPVSDFKFNFNPDHTEESP
ncbi:MULTISPECIES: signal peptidase I [unclassified Staphylococcus]|uniref:signal peptidase I n=1 Tax=unclassified Staphylococcus TaxID=91994 RepID=UPI0021D3B14C|nr:MULTISPECIES: signal peptidase I [unclassified Staphylococcus]UXR70093.1 signal peptidase I [Staphylococcus sp. IVB6246]UXR72153.1 signal peptidase I [Staphylococcus sp. IVB6240]UXR74461.1 signal peptidase I [Staphylococcus sp. IVB6238]UXR76845.1 signal peptidase I [Staphylococcus sp. IVB6233]UXR80972.1 signal peptidase I [Staphylococcus sp. IVB6218]